MSAAVDSFDLDLPEKLDAWKKLLQHCHAHVQQFWGMPIQVDSTSAHREWLTNFVALNQELVDTTSLTDLLYVIRCYILVIQHASTIDRMPACDLKHIGRVFTHVKLLAVQNTPATRSFYPTASTLAELELQVAYFVVFEFSRGPTVLETTMEAIGKDAIETLPAELAARVREARSLDFKEPAAKAVEEGTLAIDPTPGSIWLPGSKSLIRTFVGMCSRVFLSVCRDAELKASMHVRLAPIAIATPANRLRLETWLQDRCRVESTNLFMIQFRNFVFESSLPMNTVDVAQSRKSSRTSKLTSASGLLDNDCGFMALSRLNYELNVELATIAASGTHELHGMLLAVMFGYVMYQTSKAAFLGVHYLNSQVLHITTELPEFLTKTKWGMNQRPIIIELQRRLYVCDISGPDQFDRETDETNKRVECIECKDMYDALLYWMHLMHSKYDDELLAGNKLLHFYGAFMPV
jgi:hypothetical protein